MLWGIADHMGSHKRVITSLFAFQAREDVDSEARLTYNPRKGGDLNFLDDLCLTIHDLPTVQAAVACTSGLAHIPIYASYKRDGNLGGFGKCGIDINMVPAGRDSTVEHFDVQLATLPHELRHGYQDVRGCMKLVEDPRVRPHLEDHILFDRVIEADATAFSLVVMYELYLFQDNQEPLNRAWEVHRGSVEAYWQAVGRDENAHWNGKAADAAFNAYFRNDNRDRLARYDLKLCEEFMRSAENRELPVGGPAVPHQMRKDLFMDYLRPISRMPFTARSGDIVERVAYRPERCTTVMDYLSDKAQDYINQSKRMLALV